MKSRELAFTATAVAALAAGDVNEVRMMEKENFSDDDLARLTAESPQWADRGTQPVQTLFLFKSIWIRPQGSQGCQKSEFFFTNKTAEFLR